MKKIIVLWTILISPRPCYLLPVNHAALNSIIGWEKLGDFHGTM